MASGNPLASIVSLTRGTFGDFHRLLVPLVWFELIFKSVVALLGFAEAALLLTILVQTTGNSAITNNEILDFLLSPSGLLIITLIGWSAATFIVLEHLGVMAIVARFERGQTLTTLGISGALASLILPLLRLKVKGVLCLIAASLPLAITGGLAYALLISRHDINYYLADRPPAFLAAIAVAVVLGLILLAIVAWVYVRTVFLFPIILYEDHPAADALWESFERTRDRFRWLGSILLTWQLLGTLISLGLVWSFTMLAELLLNVAANRFWVLIPLVTLLIVLETLLAAVVSFVLVALHCILILRLYRRRNEELGLSPLETSHAAPSPREVPKIRHYLKYWKMATVLSLAGFLGLCFFVSRQFGKPPHVLVTAHKGFSWAAPENSLSAVRKAIEAGADYAEIDVLATSDGEVVLNHDRDLMRVAGIARRIDEMTLDEIRKVEIGSRFRSEFKGEKIPTLKEVIDLARGKIKLQIEMKFYGRDLTLASRVARLVRHENFEKECAIISLNDDALREARLVNPLIRTIAIVTVSIGNVDRLDFDGLSVNSRKLKNSLIRSAKAHGKELCAWTVDDPREMVTLIERGVPNIVTNRPDLLVALRTEFESLGEVERRLLAARYLLGMKLDLTPHHLEPPTPEQERP